MTEPGRAVIHHHLVRRSHADLVVDLLTLADRYPQMRDYLLAQISVAHAEGIVQTHKDVLTRHFFPPRSVGNTNSVLVRTMLREGWSVAPSHAHAIDLTIHAVELGVRFLNEYGYRDRVLMAAGHLRSGASRYSGTRVSGTISAALSCDH